MCVWVYSHIGNIIYIYIYVYIYISLFHLRLLRCPFSGEKTTFCYFSRKLQIQKDGRPLFYTLMHLKDCMPAIAWGGGCGPQKLKQTTVIKEIRWISLFHLRLLRCPFSGEKTTFCYFSRKLQIQKDGRPLFYTLMHLKDCMPAIAFHF